MTPRTLDDCYKHFRFDRLEPLNVQCITINAIREIVRMTWHFAVAAERARVKAEAKGDEQGCGRKHTT